MSCLLMGCIPICYLAKVSLLFYKTLAGPLNELPLDESHSNMLSG